MVALFPYVSVMKAAVTQDKAVGESVGIIHGSCLAFIPEHADMSIKGLGFSADDYGVREGIWSSEGSQRSPGDHFFSAMLSQTPSPVFTATPVPTPAPTTAWTDDPVENIKVTALSGDFWGHRIISDGMGGYIVSWCSEEGAFAQKFNDAGNRMWGENGIRIAGDATDFYGSPRLCTDGMGGALFFWSAYHEGGEYEVWGQRADAAGNLQWGLNGQRIGDAGEEAVCPAAATDGNNGAYVFWAGELMYAQRIDAEGNSLWSEKILIDTGGYSPQIVSDGRDGAILTYKKWTYSYYDIWAQRLNPLGMKLWGNNSLLVSGAFNYQECPRVVSDGAGGGVFAYKSRSVGLYSIFMQRVEYDGTPSWIDDGICFYDGEVDETHLVSDGAGGAVVVWRAASDSNIYAGRVDADGNSVWNDPVPLTDHGMVDDFANSPPAAVTDGMGGLIAFFTVWDTTIYKYRLMGQRVDSSGNLLWGMNGITVSGDHDTAKSCARAAACAEGWGGAVVCWQDDRDGFSDIYIMGVDSDGGLGEPCTLLLTPIPSTPVSPTPIHTFTPTPNTTWSVDTSENLLVRESRTDDAYAHRIISDGFGGFIVVWSYEMRISKGNRYYIAAQKFNELGNRMWGPDGVLVCDYPTEPFGPRVCADGSGGAYFVWYDYNDEVRAQRITAAGVVAWQPNGVRLSSEDEYGYCPFAASGGNNGAYFVWTGYKTLVQRVSPSGTVCWNSPVEVGADYGWSGKITEDGTGGCIVVWMQYGNDWDDDIYMQRLDANGVKKWGEGGFCVCNAVDDQECPRIISDGKGGAFVMWTDERDPEDAIYVQKVRPRGSAAWETNGVCVSDFPARSWGGHYMVHDGTGGVIAVWRTTDYTLRAKRIDSSGDNAWLGSEALSTIGSIIDVAYSPVHAVTDGFDGAIAAWVGYDETLDQDVVYAQRITGRGSFPWGPGGIVLCDNSEEEMSCVRVAPCSENKGGALACWWDERKSFGQTLFVMGINHHGIIGDPCAWLISPTPELTPSEIPTPPPSATPTQSPTMPPTLTPTLSPTQAPTDTPTLTPTLVPTDTPTLTPTFTPTDTPTLTPTLVPTDTPSSTPTSSPTDSPSPSHTLTPTQTLTPSHTLSPSPSLSPTFSPTLTPTFSPTLTHTFSPTETPTNSPTSSPTNSPTHTFTPTPLETPTPTLSPTPPPVPAAGSFGVALLALLTGLMLVHSKFKS